ncbi:MAG: aquaporin [Armatimonadetes bacterium]|nr:aquaporin [Armatimonadota bacterium]MDW8120757.1 MIP/aquaporin family protein [Armatimonadota bacterium]
MLTRAMVAEFVGTFALVFAGCGAIIANSALKAEDKFGGLGIALAFGLTIMVMVYALGPASAAHFNPAVTLGFCIAGRFPWKFAPHYWIAQVAGAVIASFFHWALLNEAVNVDFGATTLKDINSGTGLIVEAILTLFLMVVIMAVATDKRAAPGIAGLAIGSAVIVGALGGGAFTGGSMNPARSLGPAIFAGIQVRPEALSQLWVYIVGPCLGAVLAALLYEYLRPAEYAKGAPQDLVDLARAVPEGG